MFIYFFQKFKFCYLYYLQSRSHGEYVFDAGSQMDKDLWIDIINKYTTTSTSTQNNGGQLPGYVHEREWEVGIV